MISSKADRDSAAASLTKRDRRILREIIETYLLTGEPVSSRRISKMDPRDLSPATIRNVMADLEEFGYLKQPHVSAGRVPTTLAYHLFIDDLMSTETVGEDLRRVIDERLAASVGGREELAGEASQLLSELSAKVSIVVIPDMSSTVLRSINLVPLSDHKVLCISVSQNGWVEHKVLFVEEPTDGDELIRMSNYLTENFSGTTILQIRDRLVALMADARAQVDQLMCRALSIAERGLGEPRTPGLFVDGTESLIAGHDLSDLTRVRRLLETFSDKARVVSLLNQCIQGRAVRVLIGDDTDLTSSLDFSLIGRRYGREGSPSGTLGVFGPSRMDYARLVPLVDYLGERLSAALQRTL